MKSRKFSVHVLPTCIPNSNMTSFISYKNYTVIKLPVYFNSHMHIDKQFINIIPK